MEVEIVGGPKDGEIYAVPDDTRWFTVARPNIGLLFLPPTPDESAEVAVETKDVEIMVRRGGRPYIQWPKGWA